MARAERTDDAFDNFDLEVGRLQDGRYGCRVAASRAGEMASLEPLGLDPTSERFRRRVDVVSDLVLRSSPGHRQRLDPSETTVRDFGSDLFEALFNAPVSRLYEVAARLAIDSDTRLRVRLRLTSSELAAVPWEFAHDAQTDQYVALRANSPFVRYLELPQHLLPLTVDPPLRVLGMIASPRGLDPLDAEAERRTIAGALKGPIDAGLLSVHWVPGETWRDLQGMLQDDEFHVFHFIGHGGFDQHRDEGFISLANESGDLEDLYASDLGDLLGDHRSIRLAVLNSCEGATSGGSDQFASSAAVLVRKTVPAVVAMQFPISDPGAIEFCRSFYSPLAKGIPIDIAVAEARKALKIRFRSGFEWAIPVLFMRSESGQLFDVSRASTSPQVSMDAARPDPDPTVKRPTADVAPAEEMGGARSAKAIQADRKPRSTRTKAASTPGAAATGKSAPPGDPRAIPPTLEAMISAGIAETSKRPSKGVPAKATVKPSPRESRPPPEAVHDPLDTPFNPQGMPLKPTKSAGDGAIGAVTGAAIAAVPLGAFITIAFDYSGNLFLYPPWLIGVGIAALAGWLIAMSD